MGVSVVIYRTLRSITNPLRELLVDTVYPRTCAMCGQRGSWVCDLCITDFTPLVSGLCCDRCGHPVILKRCECRNLHPAIVKSRAGNVYDGWIAKSVQALKYDRERDRAQYLAETLSSAFADLGDVDVIVPVPLHAKRLEWRGFNQAELLARHLGELHNVPVESALVRVKETDTQTHSSREDRLANMQGAFGVAPDWTIDRTAHYVLLDDVYTTGATLGACAEALDAAGAKSISVIALAFDLHRKDLERYRDRVRAISPQ